MKSKNTSFLRNRFYECVPISKRLQNKKKDKNKPEMYVEEFYF